MSPRWRRRLYVLLFLAAAFLLGSTAQEQLGVSFTVEGLQEFRRWVQSLGWWGPAVFILLMVFRLFIGLSSHLVLILGGLAFGVTGAILWGCLGLVVSALVLYYLARQLGADWAERRFGEQYTAVLDLTVAQSLAIAGALLVVFVLPLLSPRVRDWVRGGRGARVQR